MSLWSIAFIRTRPFASLVDGFVADWFSLRAAALLMAVPAVGACLLSYSIDRRAGRAGDGQAATRS